MVTGMRDTGRAVRPRAGEVRLKGARIDADRRNDMPSASGPLVSVLIPSYNYAQYLPAAIESVLRQTYRNFELVIVDNASTDDSLAIARSYAEQDERIRVHANEQNIGLLGNFRRAWELSQGDYVITLCADDALLPDHLGRAISYYETHPNVDLFHTSYLLMGDDGVVARSGDPPGYHGARSYAGRDEYQQLLQHENFVCLPTVLFKRKLVERLGYFDPRIKIAADYDLVIRYAKHGVRFGFVDVPSVVYRFHEDNHSGIARYVVGGAQLDEYLTMWESHLEEKYLPRLVGRGAYLLRMLEQKLLDLRTFDPNAEAIIARQQTRIAAARAQMHRIPRRLTDAQTSGPRVSVIVPTIGNVSFLHEALASIEAQSYENYEIVLVAQAAPVLDGMVSALRRPDRVRLVAVDQRRGPAHARNVGLAVAAGELIAYLDEDDLWAPDHLASVVPAFDDLTMDVVKTAARATVEVLPLGLAQRRRALASSPDVFHRVAGPWTSALGQRTPLSAVVHRRELVDAQGVFNETMPILEAQEFLLRLSRGKCGIIDRETVDVRYRAGFASQLFGERFAQFTSVATQLADAYGAPAAERDAMIAAVISCAKGLAEKPSDPALTLYLAAAISGARALQPAS
jgi:glycosyltransferase involved in cell wall biosynthesis